MAPLAQPLQLLGDKVLLQRGGTRRQHPSVPSLPPPRSRCPPHLILGLPPAPPRSVPAHLELGDVLQDRAAVQLPLLWDGQRVRGAAQPCPLSWLHPPRPSSARDSAGSCLAVLSPAQPPALTGKEWILWRRSFLLQEPAEERIK